MKVSNSGMNNSLAGLEKAKSTKVDKNPAANKGASERPSAGEIQNASQVKLSERAQMMNKAKDIASKDLNSVDEAKVARLQSLIDSGKYKVNAEAVADKLVDEHLLSE